MFQIPFANCNSTYYFGRTTAFPNQINQIICDCHSGKNRSKYNSKYPDLKSGKQKRVINAHDRFVFDVDFHDTKNIFASSSADNTVRIWKMPNAFGVNTLRSPLMESWKVDFYPTEDLILNTGSSPSIYFWDYVKGVRVAELKTTMLSIEQAKFSPDGNRIAVAGFDGKIRIWDWRKNQLISEFSGHDDIVFSLDYSRDGKHLVSGSRDGSAMLWDLKTLKGEVIHKISGGGRVNFVTFSPNDQIAIAESNGGIVLIDSLSKKKRTLHGHQGEVNKVVFDKSGRFLASSGDDGTVRVWDPLRGIPYWRAPLMLTTPPLLLSHRKWTDMSNGKEGEQKESKWSHLFEKEALFVDLSLDSRVFCAQLIGDRFELWNKEKDLQVIEQRIPNILQVRAVKDGCLIRTKKKVILFQVSGEVNVLLPEGSPSAVSSWNNEVYIIDGDRLRVFQESGNEVSSKDLGLYGASAIEVLDKDTLAIGFRDGKFIVLKNLEKSGVVFERTITSRVEKIKKGPMDTIIVGYANGGLGLWDTIGGARLRFNRLHGRIKHINFNQKQLYAATDLGNYIHWDFSTFYADYCEILRKVWREIPVIWDDSKVVVKRTTDHRCFQENRN